MRAEAASARVLSRAEEADAAALLYDVYCRTGGWTPPPGNPSGFRVEVERGRNLLVDDFAAQSTWVGGYCGARLVATARILDASAKGFEIARYRPLPERLSPERGLEVNRFAVHPETRDAAVVVRLVEEVLAQALASGRQHLLTAVSRPEPARIFLDLGFEPVDGVPFRYHPSDAQAVEALHLDLVATAARGVDRERLRALLPRPVAPK